MLAWMVTVTAVVVLLRIISEFVVMVHAELLPTPQVILALGDSFASGNGANDYDNRVAECFRSPNSWAAQFAALINENSTFINRGCSDGMFSDITNDRFLERVRKNLRGNCPIPPSDLDDFFVKREGSLQCDQFVRPQIESLDSTVDLVLFAMGANDMQFEYLVAKCFLVVFRDASGCQEQMDFVRANAATWTRNMADVLMAMAPLLKPTARVVVIQFPHITVDTPYTYNPILGGSVELTNNLRSLGFVLDDCQRNAIAMANQAANRTFVLHYDQAKALFAGHEPNPQMFCKNQDGWFIESWARPIDEIYHLNPIGHTQMASGLYNFMVPLIAPIPPVVSAPVPTPI